MNKKVLIRKINRNNWCSDALTVDGIYADAITNCLKTKNNKLSFWLVNDENDKNDIIVAMISISDAIESIDIVEIEEEEIKKNKIDLEQTDGITEIEEFAKRHFDVINLDYKKLGILAGIISENARNNDKVYRLTKGQLKEIMKSFIEKKHGIIESCSEKFKKLLAKENLI
jgi:hypothetical protein